MRRRKRACKGSKERQPKKRSHTCWKHESEREQESSTRPRQSPPTARYKARPTKTAAFSRKTVHSNKSREKRRRVSASSRKKTSRTIRKRGNCSPRAMQEREREREASRIRRAVASDRKANDIAKQVTTTREEVIRTREGK